MSMRKSLAHTCCLTALVTALLAGPVLAGDAQATFDDLFGKPLRAVKATRDTADDVDLALELLAAARLAGEYPALMAILCNTAYDLTVNVDGEQAQAIAAMELLAEGPAAQAAEGLERLVAYRREQHAASKGADKQRTGEVLVDSMVALAEAQAASGGDISEALATMRQAEQLAEQWAPNRQTKIYEASQRMSVRNDAARRARAYQEKLTTDPDDSEVRAALVRLELVELDDPQAAGKYLDASLDEFLRTYVPLAARGSSDLSPQAALEVGTWYMHLADHSETTVAAAMFRRAAKCFDRAAMPDGLAPAEQLQAKLAGRDARNKLAGVSGMPMTPGEYHEFVELVDLSEDVLTGGWRALDDGLQTRAAAPAAVRLPVKLTGSYSIQLKIARTRGAGMVGVTLPVGQREVLLRIDSAGLSGLELVDGETVVKNDTALVGRKIDNGEDKTLTIDVSVEGKRASITARVGGRTWVTWRGEVESLSVPFGWSAQQTGAVVIGSEASVWVFNSIRVKTIDAACRRLR